MTTETAVALMGRTCPPAERDNVSVVVVMPPLRNQVLTGRASHDGYLQRM